VATKQIVIADASPLIALSLIDRLSWLRHLFGQTGQAVQVVQSVVDEALGGAFAQSEARLQLAFKQGWLAIAQAAQRAAPHHAVELTALLDAGEAASLRHAAALQADGAHCLVLVDEKAARAVAKELGLAVVGTAAIVALAQRHGLTDDAMGEFKRLHEAGFWVSADIIRKALSVPTAPGKP
jgi:predicted nucleic acid-binding protein